jgi:hypothetical protein
MSYTQARRDFEFLETVAELYDQVELDAERLALMREPTRAKAAQMYRTAIALWFGEHRAKFQIGAVDAIAEAYNIKNH